MEITVEDLQHSYGKTPVITDLAMQVAHGESVAILGPSGCGKTTLLRLLAGLERPTSGRITIGDRAVAARGLFVPPEQRRVGMVFQDWALFSHMNVGRNVAYGLGRAQRTRSALKEAVKGALEMVGLGGMADRMPATLSGGQQQRVALARALAPRPEVLLLDEPFSNLDATMRDDVRTEVRQLLAELAITVIVVTHDQAEAFVMGDRVGVMRDGTLAQFDSPSGLYTLPVDEFVADFVGTSSWVAGTANGNTVSSPLGRLRLREPSHGAVNVLIRPEQLGLVSCASVNGASLNGASINGEGAIGDVALIEYYGHDAMVEVRVGNDHLKVRCEPDVPLRRGEQVGVKFVAPAAVAFARNGEAASNGAATAPPRETASAAPARS